MMNPAASENSATPDKTIGFIGTGIMGGHMAVRLSEAGFKVRAWNRTADKVTALEKKGVRAMSTAELAVEGADVVICMLSSGPICEEVLFGPAGLSDAMPKGSTLVVMSSIPVELAQSQGKRAAAKGIDYIDAPVSGGEKGALEGTLSIMAGGAPAVIEAMAPVFSPLGRVTFVGPIGSGELTKLANQMIVASNICAVAEALLMAQQGGADLAKVREALIGGFADSTILRQHGQRMIDHNFAPGGPAKYQLKDTTTAIDFGRHHGLKLPLLNTVDGIFRSMVEHGNGDLDHSAAILEIGRMNGIDGESWKALPSK